MPLSLSHVIVPAARLAAAVLGAMLLLAGCQSNPAAAAKTRPAETAPPPTESKSHSDAMPAEPAEAGVLATATRSASTMPEVIVPPEPAADPGPADLLERIRANYQIDADLSDHARATRRVAQQFDWYQRHPDYMRRVLRRAEPYLFHIVQSLEARDMPGELALLPIVESAFDPFAYSHGRASGLWQFIPGTGKRFGLKQNWWYDGRRDITESTRAALDYLEYLSDLFDGDYLLAVAAYNSGEGIVRRAVKRNRAAGKATDFWALNLPRETRAYVPKLLALRELVRDPGSYGLKLPAIADQPYFDIVPTGGQIDLALAADLADMDLDELYLLNPGFNRWATDPDGPHRLLVPMARAGSLATALASLPPTERVRWQRHRIRPGDNLGSIAARYGTTVALIKDVNNLRSNNIRAGDDLMIPAARKNLSSYRKSEASRLAAAQQTRRGRDKTLYTVRGGDSFWSIARKHGVGVRELAGWNGMSPRDTLSIGRQLVIWDAKSTSVATAAPPGDRTLRRISYTVRRGDSFARISSRFRVSIAQLQRWNKAAARQKYLRPGQKLTVYVDVTRQTG